MDVHSQEHFISDNTSYESAYVDFNVAAQPTTLEAMTTPSIVVTTSDPLPYAPATTASAQHTYSGAHFLTHNYSPLSLGSENLLQEASYASTGQVWAWEPSQLSTDSSMDVQRQMQEPVAPVASRTLGRQTRPAATRRASKRHSIIHNGKLFVPNSEIRRI